MRFIPGCLLLLLLVSSLSPVHGVLESLYTDYKCQCIKLTNQIPRGGMISRIMTSLPGNGCSVMEVIVWLKNKVALCLNPNSSGTKILLERLQRRMKSLKNSGSKTQMA